METLVIQGSEIIPDIVLDKESNKFEFSGQSSPENAVEFYKPILEWLDTYIEFPNEKTEVNCKFTYFNTASSKMIFDVLDKFREVHEKGSEVIINWYFQQDDEDMEESGKDYEAFIEVPFEFISC